MKLIARQNEIYKLSWTAINNFIDETSLAAFIAGLHDPYFGYVQAARPENLEQAYTFLCKFKSNESTSQNMSVRKDTERKCNVSRPFEGSQKRYEANTYKHREANQASSSNAGLQHMSNVNPSRSNLPVPMEIETTKSKLTLNRKLFNNNEAINDDQNNLENDLMLNFCVVSNTPEKT